MEALTKAKVPRWGPRGSRRRTCPTLTPHLSQVSVWQGRTASSPPLCGEGGGWLWREIGGKNTRRSFLSLEVPRGHWGVPSLGKMSSICLEWLPGNRGLLGKGQLSSCSWAQAEESGPGLWWQRVRGVPVSCSSEQIPYLTQIYHVLAQRMFQCISSRFATLWAFEHSILVSGFLLFSGLPGQATWAQYSQINLTKTLRPHPSKTIQLHTD